MREEDSNNESNAIKTNVNSTDQVVVGYPTKKALELMLKNLGFEYFFYDWHNVGIENWEHIEDYHLNQRVSMVAKL